RFEYRLLCRLKDCIKATDDAHRQNDIGILAALEQVAENIVSDSPDEGDNSVVRSLIHVLVMSGGFGALHEPRKITERKKSRKEEIKAADAAMFDVRGLMFDVKHVRLARDTK